MTYTVLASSLIDRDRDSIRDGDDNCPAITNNNQANNDVFDGVPMGGWVGDVCDNCLSISNPEQTDNDGLSDTLQISIGTIPLVDGDTDGVITTSDLVRIKKYGALVGL